jgi:hypothetical protein
MSIGGKDSDGSIVTESWNEVDDVNTGLTKAISYFEINLTSFFVK